MPKKSNSAVKNLPALLSEDTIKSAIRKHGGFLSYVADELDIKLEDLKKLIKKSKELRQSLTEVREMGLDLAESALVEKIKGGNLLAMMFYLKCQGQHRGWIDRPTGKAGGSPDKPLYIKLMPVANGETGEKNKGGRPKKIYEEQKILPAAAASIKEKNLIEAEIIE